VRRVCGYIVRPLHLERFPERVAPQRLERFNTERPKCQMHAFPHVYLVPKTPTCHSSFVMITSGEEPIIGHTISDPPRPKQ
jgi:hypothetical protein